MAEMERLKADEKAYKAFASIQFTTTKTLENAIISVKGVEKDSAEELDAT